MSSIRTPPFHTSARTRHTVGRAPSTTWQPHVHIVAALVHHTDRHPYPLGYRSAPVRPICPNCPVPRDLHVCRNLDATARSRLDPHRHTPHVPTSLLGPFPAVSGPTAVGRQIREARLGVVVRYPSTDASTDRSRWRAWPYAYALWCMAMRCAVGCSCCGGQQGTPGVRFVCLTVWDSRVDMSVLTPFLVTER